MSLFLDWVLTPTLDDQCFYPVPAARRKAYDTKRFRVVCSRSVSEFAHEHFDDRTSHTRVCVVETEDLDRNDTVRLCERAINVTDSALDIYVVRSEMVTVHKVSHTADRFFNTVYEGLSTLSALPRWDSEESDIYHKMM
ncbi:MAG: hypothetical protein RL094_634 [Candidatus Parcubacteria bacterium]|jgi:Mg2+/Co2+ transporter CorC